VPPGLLEEVFALNEELDEIRDLRESGTDAARWRRVWPRRASRSRPSATSTSARSCEASEQWDRQADAPADARRATLESLRQLLLERNYITNLLGDIEREAAPMGKVVGIDLGTTNSLVAYAPSAGRS
jgi:hypothetical protein